MAEWTEGKDTYDESEDFGPADYTIHYRVDEYDFKAVQEAIIFRQSPPFLRMPDGSLMLPDGEGDLGGRILAQICRYYVDKLNVPASLNEGQKREMREHGLTEAEYAELDGRTREASLELRAEYAKARERLYAEYAKARERLHAEDEEAAERKRAELRAEILGRRGEGE
jgi:hypothetical protein